MGGFQSIGPISNAADVKIPDESPYPEDKDDEEQTEDPEDDEDEAPEDDEDDEDSGASSNTDHPFVQITEAPDPDVDLTALPPPEEAPEETPTQDEPVKAPSGEMKEFDPNLSQRWQSQAERNIDAFRPQTPSRSLLEPLSLQTPGVPAEPRRATGGLPDLLSPDPALTPDPTFKIPHIPDKVWEEGDRLRAEKAEAAQAKEAPQTDWWQARNMADALSRTTDYGGAEQHYRRQAESDPVGTRTEIDGVAQAMGQTDPQSAQRFLGQMDAAGLRGTDTQPRGRSYSESDLLGSWRSNIEDQTGQTLTPAADTRTSASSEDQSTPPANKSDFFKSRNPSGTWDDFRGEVQSLPDTGQAGKFALVEVFGQEGGVPKDSASTASAGILQRTLDNAKGAGVPGLEKATTPNGLTNEQRAAVMRYKLDREELSHVGGVKALDKIGDNQAAAALADTLYRHGGVEGPRLLQRAINDVEPGAVPKTGFMGKQTLEAYSRLASSPETKGRLLDALAEQRKLAARDPNERARFDYYRYLGRR